jgi:hypothetical protein
MALTTIAFAVLAWLVGGSVLAAIALLLGGGAAAIQRLRKGREGWGLMAPGSTPRLVLTIGGGLLALWIATSVMTGPGAPLRFAALSVLGLMGARVLITNGHTDALLTALAALALSVAIAAGIADTWPGPSPFIAAALIAVGVSVIRVAEP